MTHSINVHDTVQRITSQLDRVVIGYPEVKLLSTAALFTDHHVLLEGMPGTAKSLFVVSYQRLISNSSCARLQMTPDIKPMDIVGFEVYNPGTGKFEIRKGPIHSQHFVLVDEINRTPGKTLSALLSSMQERKIYIAGVEFPLDELFFVMATQNPIEQEGVYPLPEAQLDRFGMKINVGYAKRDDEMTILNTDCLETRNPESILEPVITVEEVLAIRKHLQTNVFVSVPAKNYILDLNRSTRPCHEEHARLVNRAPKLKDMVTAGCSMRAAMAMQSLSRAIAAFSGRNFVLPEDIQKVAPSVLRHRTVTSFEAQAEGFKVDDAMKLIMDNVDFHSNKDDYAPSVK
ncbi:MAG TPA: MoxR family ATPase [Candidatus Melainabacteria bacterium]|nr:MoxR family ATPase [Candidatus Melainabacteria bacterium]